MFALYLGFSYCASFLHAHLEQEPSLQHAATRRKHSRTDLRLGIEPIPLEPPFEALRRVCAEADVILCSAPPLAAAQPAQPGPGRQDSASSPSGDPFLDLFVHESIRIRPGARLMYLSSTGVYGDAQGAWVDEETPPHPTTGRGMRRLKAEQAWEALCHEHQIHLTRFRVGGIYGPGRNALCRVQQGLEKIYDKPGQVFNRIHAADIGRALYACWLCHQKDPGVLLPCYNLVDGHPSSPQSMSLAAFDLMGKSPPAPLPPPVGASMGASFYAENKRVKNDRLLGLLAQAGLEKRLVYPDYRAGLASLHADMQADL